MTTREIRFAVASKLAARLPERWRGLFDTHRVSVHLDVLVCQRTPVYKKWGYAGNSIEHFPPYGFFKLYFTNRNAGIEAFKDWYRQRFFVEREWLVASSEGGLKESPLHRLIVEMHRKTGRPLGPDDLSFDRDVVERAIELRVSHYVSVLTSLPAAWVSLSSRIDQMCAKQARRPGDTGGPPPSRRGASVGGQGIDRLDLSESRHRAAGGPKTVRQSRPGHVRRPRAKLE